MNPTVQPSNPPPSPAPIAVSVDDQRPRGSANSPPPPGPAAVAPRVGGSSARPVWQTLAIVGILLAGLAGGMAILRMKPPAPASEEGHAEHGAAGGEKKDDGHGHGAAEHDAHGHGGAKDAHGGEGRVEMNAAKLKNANLKIEEAGSARVRNTLRLYGKVSANEETMAHVSPRFPGIVKGVRKRLGDPVARGETLATVESNDSLRTYEVKSEVAGTVTAKDVTLGELVNDQKVIFTVTDLSSVYVDLNVYREDFGQLKVGQTVFLGAVRRGSGDANANAGESRPIESTITYLSPFGAENTQSMLARAVVPNPDGALRPGLFINARVVTGEVEAPIAVRAAALQTMDRKPVVFVQEGDRFEARPVEIGERDPEWVEIISGVLPGDKYVAGNSFILKAEIGKEGAAHEH